VLQVNNNQLNLRFKIKRVGAFSVFFNDVFASLFEGGFDFLDGVVI